MTSKKTGYLLGALAGAGVMAAAVAGAGVRLPQAHAGDQPHVIRASTSPIFAPPPGAPMSFSDIFDRVSPAVVSINVTTRVDANALRIPGLPFDIVPRAPDEDEEGAPPNGGRTEKGQPRLPTQQSAGSGFFISQDGYVVTNNHVVENAESIKVVLKDETELEGVVVGRDEATDLAVIKVKGRNGPFPFVNFENAAKPRVGDWVIAVGNPFGLGGTATAGIISAYGRDIGETFVDYIQIDAPINRGNSGGPTFDIYGRVIGVNTAIFSPSGGSVGIGFAIPAEVADQVTKQLISGRKIERGYIGATIQNFTTEMAEAQGMGEQRGAIVSDLTPGGPSQKAGLQAGDVIVSINGHTVRTSSELTREVAKARPGDVLRIEIIRDGKRRNVEVRSGTRPSERELAASAEAPDSENGGPGAQQAPRAPAVLGLSLAPLDAGLRSKLGLPANVKGAVVLGVDSNSDAGQKGLKTGDVIVRAGDAAVTTPQDVTAAVDAAKKAKRPSVLVGVFRGGRTLFLPLKID
ncbi:Do family serine endopeptidase [Phenylobacterium sp. LjRoot219]|uniref:Do family serine endopeptidase n=1 Tax=Phenylobacterium sp. LjRoot219 TaxID=3342283 RepID=UPI003ECD31DC